MPEFKYVMLCVKQGTLERLVPVIFPKEIVHADLAEALRRLPQYRGAKAETAGMVRFHAECTYGHSETLKLPSNALDALVINTHDLVHGIVPEDEK